MERVVGGGGCRLVTCEEMLVDFIREFILTVYLQTKHSNNNHDVLIVSFRICFISLLFLVEISFLRINSLVIFLFVANGKYVMNLLKDSWT